MNKPTIGTRARVASVDSVCKFLWNKPGVITKAPYKDFITGEQLWRLELDEVAKRYTGENNHSGMKSIDLTSNELKKYYKQTSKP